MSNMFDSSTAMKMGTNSPMASPTHSGHSSNRSRSHPQSLHSASQQLIATANNNLQTADDEVTRRRFEERLREEQQRARAASQQPKPRRLKVYYSWIKRVFPFTFHVQPSKLARMTVENASRKLSVSFADIVTQNNFVQMSEDCWVMSMNNAMKLTSTVGQIEIAPQTHNDFYMPMAVFVDLIRPDYRDRQPVEGFNMLKSFHLTMSTKDSRRYFSTTTLEPGFVFQDSVTIRQSPQSTENFLLLYCDEKGIQDVCAVQQVLDNGKVELKMDDPVITWLKKESAHEGRNRWQRENPNLPYRDLDKIPPQERMAHESRINEYTETERLKRMTDDKNHGTNFVDQKVADSAAEIIRMDYQRSITLTNLLPTPNYPKDSGFRVSIWPDCASTGHSENSERSKENLATVFSDRNNPYLKAKLFHEDEEGRLEKEAMEIQRQTYTVRVNIMIYFFVPN